MSWLSDLLGTLNVKARKNKLVNSGEVRKHLGDLGLRTAMRSTFDKVTFHEDIVLRIAFFVIQKVDSTLAC